MNQILIQVKENFRRNWFRSKAKLSSENSQLKYWDELKVGLLQGERIRRIYKKHISDWLYVDFKGAVDDKLTILNKILALLLWRYWYKG